jgi:hypothetical protein
MLPGSSRGGDRFFLRSFADWTRPENVQPLSAQSAGLALRFAWPEQEPSTPRGPLLPPFPSRCLILGRSRFCFEPEQARQPRLLREHRRGSGRIAAAIVVVVASGGRAPPGDGETANRSAIVVPDGSLLVSVAVESLERILRGVQLPSRFANGPSTCGSIDRHHDPAGAVLAAEVHEERVFVVLHASAMIRVALLMEEPRLDLSRVCHERSPVRSRWTGQIGAFSHGGERTPGQARR